MVDFLLKHSLRRFRSSQAVFIIGIFHHRFLVNVLITFVKNWTNCNLAGRDRRTPWLPLWGSWLPHRGRLRGLHGFFECYYLTAVPSQSACSADSSPKGRAKGRCRICPSNNNLSIKILRRRTSLRTEHTGELFRSGGCVFPGCRPESLLSAPAPPPLPPGRPPGR